MRCSMQSYLAIISGARSTRTSYIWNFTDSELINNINSSNQFIDNQLNDNKITSYVSTFFIVSFVWNGTKTTSKKKRLIHDLHFTTQLIAWEFECVIVYIHVYSVFSIRIVWFAHCVSSLLSDHRSAFTSVYIHIVTRFA